MPHPNKLDDLARLHHHLLSEIVATGHAPSIAEMSHQLGWRDTVLRENLRALEAYHGAVLHPHNDEVWVIHPFSLAPTNFWVSSSRGSWWGNCAWCSLGVAALLQEDCTIHSRLGAEQLPVELEIVDGQLRQKDLLIHFPIPMRQAWDNVIYTCSTMLLFASETDIDRWCEQHGIGKGDVQRAENIWTFSQKWYGRHLDRDWRKWTQAEAKALFTEFGLTHPVWQLEDTQGRF
ncbi:MAG: alkylmercury lyase family protein [Bacteroidota bacterium]